MLGLFLFSLKLHEVDMKCFHLICQERNVPEVVLCLFFQTLRVSCLQEAQVLWQIISLPLAEDPSRGKKLITNDMQRIPVINCHTQFEPCELQCYLVIQVYWGDSGTSGLGVTNHFWTGFRAYPSRLNTSLTLLTRTKTLGFLVMGSRGKATTIILQNDI